VCEHLHVPSSVASRIVRARKRLDISDAELARRLNVTRSTVHAWVHGEHEPNLASLRRIARALGCEVAELLGAS
jgi:transcriptional regulator with XRE-family HTH domain